MVKSSKYFSEEELKCLCCGTCEMDEAAMAKFDEAREISGIPWFVTSGYRCPKHDAEIGGDGNHPKGKALDISTHTDSRTRFKIVCSLLKVGATRIGIAKRFVHGDFVESHPQGVIWLY